jgi:hypothetical protein
VKGLIETLFDQRRSLETALTELLTRYERDPSPELSRTIELLRVEIEIRKGKLAKPP